MADMKKVAELLKDEELGFCSWPWRSFTVFKLNRTRKTWLERYKNRLQMLL